MIHSKQWLVGGLEGYVGGLAASHSQGANSEGKRLPAVQRGCEPIIRA